MKLEELIKDLREKAERSINSKISPFDPSKGTDVQDMLRSQNILMSACNPKLVLALLDLLELYRNQLVGLYPDAAIKETEILARLK